METIKLYKHSIPKGAMMTAIKKGVVIECLAGTDFPHITFHADEIMDKGDYYALVYYNTAKYHVVTRSGVYYGRMYSNDTWIVDPQDTNANFPTDLELGESYALDIEPVLQVLHGRQGLI